MCEQIWNIKGNKVEWCTQLPQIFSSGFINSPSFSINGVKCNLKLSMFVPSACYGNQFNYGIKLNQNFESQNKPYQSFPVTVQAVLMSDEKVKFPSMASSNYNPNRFIWLFEGGVLKEKIKDWYKKFYKFIFLFEDVPEPLPSNKNHKVSNEIDVSRLPQLDLESLSQDWSELLRTSAHSDVQLKCEDGVLQAHRVVLAARSKVFSAMLEVDMKESRSGVVDMADVNVAALKLFLEFVYSGRMKTLPSDMVPKLYSLGDKYDVHSLRTMCAFSMISNLSKENYVQYLHLATLHNDEHFIKALVDCISKDYLHPGNQSDREQVIDKFKEKILERRK